MPERQERRPSGLLLGESLAIQKVREQIKKAALTEVPVLITGESGTGKEVASRHLHELSRRASHGFHKVNCAAIPAPLFESELFGYEAGAFTGARTPKPGKLEQANLGTLLIDEIGELDSALQAKLLHALEDFRIVRLGAIEERKVDVRLICATNSDLEVAVSRGKFRSDLFYRINVLRIDMPTLRERASDVPILLSYFVDLYSERFGTRPEPLSSSFVRLLGSYNWPGNIRELENVAKRYVVLGAEEQIVSMLHESEELNVPALDPVDLNTPLRVQTKRAIQHLEKKIILNVLQAHKWNRRKTARTLNISYRALLYKIKEAGLPPMRTVRAGMDKMPANGSENALEC